MSPTGPESRGPLALSTLALLSRPFERADTSAAVPSGALYFFGVAAPLGSGTARSSHLISLFSHPLKSSADFEGVPWSHQPLSHLKSQTLSQASFSTTASVLCFMSSRQEIISPCLCCCCCFKLWEGWDLLHVIGKHILCLPPLPSRFLKVLLPYLRYILSCRETRCVCICHQRNRGFCVCMCVCVWL